MPRVPQIHSALAALFAAICLATAVWQCQISYASYLATRQTPERLSRAAEISPRDAILWRQLGVAQLRNSSPNAGESLRHAVMLNPTDAESWAALGLSTEIEGETAEAETAYKKGAGFTRRYRPKLALAFYYFRAHDAEKFWDAAADAAAVPGAYLGRIFEFAHDMTKDPDMVPDKLRLHSAYSLASYLSFLIETNRPGALAAVSRQVPATEEHRDRLFSATERLIQEGDESNAVAVWNRLAVAGHTGTEPLDPVEGRSTTNAGLLQLPPRGFNWRSANLAGATLIFQSGGGLRIEFSGEQPEKGDVLFQWLPVEPERDYKLRVQYGSNNIHQTTGLRWSVQGSESGVDLSGGQAVLAPTAEGTAEAKFRSPAQVRLLRLILTYTRVPGTVRINGDVTLHDVRAVPSA